MGDIDTEEIKDILPDTKFGVITLHSHQEEEHNTVVVVYNLPEGFVIFPQWRLKILAFFFGIVIQRVSGIKIGWSVVELRR